MKWRRHFSTVFSLTVLVASQANAEPKHHGSAVYTPDLYRSAAPVEGSFTRMFPLDAYDLQPHPSPRYDLARLGAADGPMNEGTSDAPVADSQIEAGITFFGQFVDHDITLDLTTTLDARANPEQTRNFRTPDLDLDCIYGDGPEGSPWLYERGRPYLIVGTEYANGRHDLARAPGTGVALIGDPRNDENFIVSQIQAAFIAFHNKVAKEILDFKIQRAGATELTELDPSVQAEFTHEAFEEARNDVIHYYHRMLAEYFLPQVIGVTRTIDIVTNGRRFYLKELRDSADNLNLVTPNMPVEFSAAAYRFGHSQVRQKYRLRKDEPAVDLFKQGVSNGFSPVTEEKLIDFAMFFPIPSRTAAEDKPQTTRQLDPRLPDAVFRLDKVNVTPANAEASLASRNLLRGRTFRLPAGEDLFKIVAGGSERGDLNEFAKSRLRPAAQAAYSPQAQLKSLNDSGDWIEYDIKTSPFYEAPQEITNYLAVPLSPLWYFILHEAANWDVTFSRSDNSHQAWPTEAQLQASVFYLADEKMGIDEVFRQKGQQGSFTGQILGPVGGTIVGEVIIGLIDHYREKTNRGIDHRPHVTPSDLQLTTFSGFGQRMTFGDMIRYIGWDEPI